MKVISVLNHKGGVGKSTIATNIAGCYANRGEGVLIGDFDIQQSSRNWLNLRPENAIPIGTWEIENGKLITPPENTSHIIVDSPAGLSADSLKHLVSISDKIITPVKPGIFDMLSTEVFLREIVEVINDTDKEIDICIVGNMVDPRTKACEQLQKFIDSLGINCPTYIHQGQLYVHLAAHGLSIFDSKSNVFEKQIMQWEPLIEWIDN